MSDKSLAKLLPAVVPLVRRKSSKEIEKLVRDTATMRFMGYTFMQISKHLGVSYRQVERYYSKFIEENKKDWLEHKGRVLTEINVSFKRALFFAERKRHDMNEQKDFDKAGAWNKQVIDTMGKYVVFLKDCGFVTTETVDGFAITADAKKTDVIGELVDGYQDYLKEVIESEEKPASDTKASSARA